jgi:hypothetical protein
MLLNAATALSLALCAAVCVLWARSLFVVDSFPTRTAYGTIVWVMSFNHQVQLLVMRDWRAPAPAPYHGPFAQFGDWGRYGPRDPRPAGAGPAPRKWRLLMSSISGWSGDVPAYVPAGDRRVTEHLMPGWGLTVDAWVLALATGALPAARAWPRVRRALFARRRRRTAGLCPTCGYDLRATPDRCSECGRAAKT